MPLQCRPIEPAAYLSQSSLLQRRSVCVGINRPAHPVRIEAQIRGSLSFEVAVEEPFRPAAGVVLLRSEAEEEDQLRIREAAVHLARLGLEGGRIEQSLHKVRVRRLCFGVVARVREVPVVRAVAVVSTPSASGPGADALAAKV